MSRHHPWRTGLLVAVNVMSLALYKTTPFCPSMNKLMYPLSESLGTLINECNFRSGSTCASLAFSVSLVKGSLTLCKACMVFPFGKFTILIEGPILGNLSDVRTKCDVAPESTIIACPFLLKRRSSNCQIFCLVVSCCFTGSSSSSVLASGAQ